MMCGFIMLVIIIKNHHHRDRSISNYDIWRSNEVMTHRVSSFHGREIIRVGVHHHAFYVS